MSSRLGGHLLLLMRAGSLPRSSAAGGSSLRGSCPKAQAGFAKPPYAVTRAEGSALRVTRDKGTRAKGPLAT